MTEAGEEPQENITLPDAEEWLTLRNLLLDCLTVSDKDRCEALIRLLPDEIRHEVDQSNNPKLRAFNLVQTCARFPQGIDKLAINLYRLERSSKGWQKVEAFLIPFARNGIPVPIDVRMDGKEPIEDQLGKARPKDYIPFSRYTLFKERPGEFEALESYLFGSGTARVGLVSGQSTMRSGLAMVGMGGVGKTQLAVELVYRCREQDRFPGGIFWMTATGERDDWQRELARLAADTDYLPPDDKPSEIHNERRRARYFCRYLAEHADALLVLDNVERPELVTVVLPEVAGLELKCAMVYTSRSRTRLDGVVLHNVDQLTEEASLRLLLEETRPALLRAALDKSIELEALAAQKLCRNVGYLPLALRHLRSVLESDSSLKLNELGLAIQQEGIIPITAQDPRLPPLFRTFELSWQRVNTAEAKRMFVLAALFPEAAPIPLWLLGLAAGLGEDSTIIRPLGQARNLLQRLSLLEELEDGQVRLHPLVREFGLKLLVIVGEPGVRLLQLAAELIVRAFEDLKGLEVRARLGGFWEQARMALNYAGELDGQGGALFRQELTRAGERLEQVIRRLDRESYYLANPEFWPDKLPNLFYQQLYNCLVEEGHAPTPQQEGPWLQLLEPVRADDRALIKILSGHNLGISSVAFSLDGSKILTGSQDKTVCMWETASGRLLTVLRGHTEAINSVAFSPDGSKILTAGDDKTARIWNVANASLKVILQNSDSAISCAEFSSDGSKILTSSQEGTCRLWEAGSGNLIKSFNVRGRTIKCAAFSPDGSKIVAGLSDGSVYIWSTDYGNVLATVKNHNEEVSTVIFSPDGSMILSGSSDKTIKLCNIATNRLFLILEGHTNTVTSVAFNSDGSRIVSGSFDGTARLWDSSSGHLVTTFQGHNSIITSVAFSSNGYHILTGSADKTARLWDSRAASDSGKFQEEKQSVTCVAFSRKGTKILTNFSNNMVCLRDTTSGEIVSVFKGHSDRVNCLAFSPDGTKMVTGSSDKTIQMWTAASTKPIAVFQGHSGAVFCTGFSPDGSRIVSGADDKLARLWEIQTGRILVTISGHSGPVISAAFNHKGSRVLTGSSDRSARLWDSVTGRQVMNFSVRSGPVYSVAFSSDDSKILIGSGNLESAGENIAYLWDSASGQCIIMLKGHAFPVSPVTFSPDGHLLITGDINGQVRVWQGDGPKLGQLLALYQTGYRVKAFFWASNRELWMADDGGPGKVPHIYRLRLEGM